jgi:hypothetical protein
MTMMQNCVISSVTAKLNPSTERQKTFKIIIAAISRIDAERMISSTR